MLNESRFIISAVSDVFPQVFIIFLPMPTLWPCHITSFKMFNLKIASLLPTESRLQRRECTDDIVSLLLFSMAVVSSFPVPPSSVFVLCLVWDMTISGGALNDLDCSFSNGSELILCQCRFGTPLLDNRLYNIYRQCLRLSRERFY